MRAALSVTFILLTSAAPSGAALPQEAAAACEALGATVIFIGTPGKPAEVLVSFEDRIRPARERWLKAQAEADGSKDTEVHIRAIRAFDDYESLRIRYPEPRKMVLIPVEVETHLKGATPPLVYLQNMGLDELEPGRRYVLFSDFLMPPDMEDRIMNPAGIPQAVEKAELSLRLIREALAASYGGTVIGSIEYEPAGDPANKPTAAAGLTVRIASPGFILNTTSDTDGIFLVTGVPSGQVSATPSLPNGLAIVDDKSGTKTLGEGACVPLQMQAALNGRIRGRAVGAGGIPRAGMKIRLVPSTDRWWAHDQRYDVTTNDRGEFEFRTIPPGSYFVGYEHIVSGVWSSHPPLIYYPGTPDPAAAMPVVVGKATLHEGFDFTVVR